jgi:hypothetical protein
MGLLAEYTRGGGIQNRSENGHVTNVALCPHPTHSHTYNSLFTAGFFKFRRTLAYKHTSYEQLILTNTPHTNGL